jgi:hypothetical protein
METLLPALWPALAGAFTLSAKLLLIVVPLVMIFEVLRYLPVFRRAGRAVEPMMHGMGLSPQAAVPLFTGIFLGIAYGAGIIIRVAQEKRLPKRELFLMGLFLATCHAVVEDTLIFVVVGGNGWIILGVRLLIAFGLTAGLAWLWRARDRAGGEEDREGIR